MSASPEAGSLRIVTWNIRHAAPEDSYRGDPQALAEICHDFNADILALQEVDVNLPRTGRQDLPQLVADACNMDYVFAKSRRNNFQGQFGNALFVRGKIMHDYVDILPMSGDHRHPLKFKGKTIWQPIPERRTAIIAPVKVRGQYLIAGTTHAAGPEASPEVKQQQCMKVLRATALRVGPLAVAGDFNVGAQKMRHWTELCDLDLVDPQPTFPVSAPTKILDHIVTRGLTVHEVQTRRLPISDHLAVIVSASLAPAGPR